MSDLEEVEAAAEAFAEARNELFAEVSDLDHVIRTQKRLRMPRIRELVAEANTRMAGLHASITASKDAFQKPKTRVFSGIRVGFEKGKGKVEFADADAVVALIRKRLKGQVRALVKVKATPIKDAIAKLSGKDLKRIGAEIVGAGDQLVIRPTDTDLEKLVDALLDKADEGNEGEQAEGAQQ